MKKFVAMLMSATMAFGMAGTAIADEAAAPDENGYINCLLAAEPSTLDVAKFMNIYDRTVLLNVLEPLTRVEGGVVTPAGAESWELAEDGLSYTFHLRENYWSDGEAVTADDYAYALQREADPVNAWSLASDMSSIKNFDEIYNGEAELSELGVEVVDDSTLIIYLGAADVTLLSTADIFPCRQDYVEQYGDSYGTEPADMIYCGPYAMTEWVHGSTLTFVKNENYWDADSVNLSTYTYKIISDTNAQAASLENGSLDYLGVTSSEYIAKYSADANFVSEKVSAARTQMVVFNCQDEVFSNQKIRQAFSLALDREALAEIITGGTATAAYSLIPGECSVGELNFRANTAQPLEAVAAANPDAKALLIAGMEEAGLGSDPSALTVSFAWGSTSSDARTYAELYQQLWQATLGVTVNLEFNDSTTHMSNIGSGAYQMAIASWGANLEPQFQLSRWANARGGQSKWVNEEYCSLVQEASCTADDQKRLELYAQAEEMLVTEAAIAPVYWTGSMRFAYDYVKGISANPFDTTGMKYVYTSGR